MDTPPSIFIEPPEEDHHHLVNTQELPGSLTLYADLSSTGDDFYNQPNTSTESLFDNFPFFSMTPSLFLDTNFAPPNFTAHRPQPDSPNSPFFDTFSDDASDVFYPECPSPGAFSDSSTNSPYPTTPLLQDFNNLNFQELSSPQLLGVNDTGQGPTIAPGDLQFGGPAHNGSYEKPPVQVAVSNGYNPEYPEDSLILPQVPLVALHHSRARHRSMLSEPNIPTNSLLMQATGADAQSQPLSVQTEGPRHYRSHSESNGGNDLLSPESAQGQGFRGRRERRGGSRPQSRRSSPYERPNTSQESFHDFGGVESYLVADLHASRHQTPSPSSASFPGTPILGSSREASSSTQSLVSSSTSIMVINSGNYEFDSMLNNVNIMPRKVGSDKLDEASNKRRKNPAKHTCQICGRALTTKHNVKNHMKSHYNIKDHVCVDCGKGFTTGHVLKRHWKVCQKRKKRIGVSKDSKEIIEPDESCDAKEPEQSE